MEYVPEPFGYQPLREAYASYLIRARAVKVSHDRLITFASRNLRLDLISRLLLNEGDLIAIEEPGFSAAREQFLANGAQIAPIGVDNQGLIVEQLKELKTAPRLIYVTPSHQAPTGAVMSMNRRKQLLEYAAKNQAYIIEDDYDSEFRYDGRPLPSLQGMDNNDRTIYLSCLWNAMAPVSRIGFMVVPDPLVEPMSRS
jgi:GntR family transcriptional regulator/MocR family aminotransferase